MKKTLFLSLLFAGALLAACKEEVAQPELPAPLLSVDKVKIEATSEAMSTTITVTSNRSWTIDAGTADWITFEPSSVEISADGGDVDTPVTVTISANLDKWPRELNAYLICDDDKMDPLKVNILQESPQAEEQDPEIDPNAVFSVTFPEAHYVNSRVFSSLGGAPRYFTVNCNKKWTAKVGSETTATGVELTTTSGEGNCDKFEVKCDPNKDLDNRKKIVIEFTVKGISEVQKVEMDQEKGSIMDIECRTLDNSEGFWPFVEDGKDADTGYSGTGALTCAGYTFNYLASDVCCYETIYGWRVGSKAGDYFTTPAIEGKKLKSIGVVDVNDKVKTITKTDGTAVEFTQSPEAIVKKEITTYTLTASEVNTSYRFIINAKGTMRIYLVRLVYE